MLLTDGQTSGQIDGHFIHG